MLINVESFLPSHISFKNKVHYFGKRTNVKEEAVEHADNYDNADNYNNADNYDNAENYDNADNYDKC